MDRSDSPTRGFGRKGELFVSPRFNGVFPLYTLRKSRARYLYLKRGFGNTETSQIHPCVRGKAQTSPVPEFNGVLPVRLNEEIACPAHGTWKKGCGNKAMRQLSPWVWEDTSKLRMPETK